MYLMDLAFAFTTGCNSFLQIDFPVNLLDGPNSFISV